MASELRPCWSENEDDVEESVASVNCRFYST